MRHVILLIMILANVLGTSAAASRPAADLPAAQQVVTNAGHFFYMPLIAVPEIPPPPAGTQLLQNGSFEDENWRDVNGSIQEPRFWTIDWVPPGQAIFSFPDKAWADPEFTHKYDWQLPAEEQPGEPGALILDGHLVYKIFHGGASFGAEMRQTVSGLTPGMRVRLTVPILLDPRNESSDYGAASGVWINGAGNGDGWAWLKDMGNRNWYTHTLETTVPGDGRVEILIRMFSKWQGVDYFIDDVRLEPIK